ncbi:MAG: hypothetical protein RBU37_10090 [Myxococcota bacterium]|jgi:hypothetical protein|nr:hypothetical protein [Myxococcota bacterium]
MPNSQAPADSSSPESLSFDHGRADAAWLRVAERAKALKHSSLRKPNSDYVQVALAGLKLFKRVRSPELAPAFAKLPSKHFDHRHLEWLGDLAWALWHLNQRVASAAAQTSAVRVDPAVVEETKLRRKRVLTLLSYHLGDDPQIASQLAALSSGRGYEALSSDANWLGELWLDHEQTLSKDPKRYVPGDGQRLVQLGELMMTQLLGRRGADEELRDWRRRVWTLFCESYEEVVAAGSFLFRKSAHAVLFRPLVAELRPRQTRKKE